MNLKNYFPKPFFFIVFIFSTLAAQAQRKNTVLMNIPLGNRLPFSLGFERKIFQEKQSNFSIHLTANYGKLDYSKELEKKVTIPDPIIIKTGDILSSIFLSSLFSLPLSTTDYKREFISVDRAAIGGLMVLGNKKHGFEMGINMTIDGVKREEFDGIRNTKSQSKKTQFLLLPNAAYHYQSNSGFILKIGTQLNKSYGLTENIKPHLFGSVGFSF